ncbi:hypothetical protein [uncultured Ruminococcus sp.]|uniref:hypothetical protein n=1 Tax=uncultured Ruminococcus sp. TaxID=165186 RepID=UPI002930E680|nr:hypothetical protein [uncultured Ruminococcus sp.]
MLVVKPDPQNENNEIKALNAFLDDQPCGYVRFHLNGYIIIVDEIIPLAGNAKEIDHSTYAILDTIIRALGSYGLNHSCFYVESENPVIYPTLEAMRFSLKDGKMKSDLSKLLNHQHH